MGRWGEVRFSVNPRRNYPAGLSRDNTTCVALSGESPSGLLRLLRLCLQGMMRRRLIVCWQERRSRGPIKSGLGTRDDVNSLCINNIPEAEKDKSIVRFALDCAARFFFFLLLLSVILNVLSQGDKANRCE